MFSDGLKLCKNNVFKKLKVLEIVSDINNIITSPRHNIVIYLNRQNELAQKRNNNMKTDSGRVYLFRNDMSYYTILEKYTFTVQTPFETAPRRRKGVCII